MPTSNRKYKQCRQELMQSFMKCKELMQQKEGSWETHMGDMKKLICESGLGFMLSLENNLRPRITTDNNYRLFLDDTLPAVENKINEIVAGIDTTGSVIRVEYNVSITPTIVRTAIEEPGKERSHRLLCSNQAIEILKGFFGSAMPAMKTATSHEADPLCRFTTTADAVDYIKMLQERWMVYIKDHELRPMLTNWFSCSLRSSAIQLSVRFRNNGSSAWLSNKTGYDVSVACAHAVLAILKKFTCNLPNATAAANEDSEAEQGNKRSREEDAEELTAARKQRAIEAAHASVREIIATHSVADALKLYTWAVVGHAIEQ